MISARTNKDSGFTLVEVMAALLIFSVAIIGLISANTQSVRTVRSIETKMIAGVIADNVIVEARRKDLQIGEKDGQVQSMGREFQWEQAISATEIDNFFRISVQVREVDSETIILERIAYRDRPS